MDRRRIAIIMTGLAIFALVDGIILGMFSTWWTQVPSAAEATQRDAEEYVWLVSAGYAADGDLNHAERRLHLMQPDDALTIRLVSETAQHAILNADVRHTHSVLQLARAMGVDPIEMIADSEDVDLAPQAMLIATAPDEAPNHPEAAPLLVAGPTVQHGFSFLAPALATATATRVPTKVPTKAPTAKPTDAPILAKVNPKPTAVAAVPVAALAAARASPQPARAVSAPAGVNYVVSSVRRLTACENGGNHHLFILVVDAQGNGVPGLPVEVVWPSGATIVNTGLKVENLPPLGINAQNTSGYVNFAMYHGSYKVRVLNGVSQQTDWLTVDIPHDEYCAANDNPQGNSTFHYSYLIVFQKVR